MNGVLVKLIEDFMQFSLFHYFNIRMWAAVEMYQISETEYDRLGTCRNRVGNVVKSEDSSAETLDWKVKFRISCNLR